jgi:RHS repeat-associated protein
VENALGGSEDVEYVEAVYSSEGLLHGLTRVEFVPVGEEGETEARTTEFSVFYFAGRPVAQVKELDSATEWMFLTTDHLGTPLLATNLSGNDHWAGPFEPFGKDFFQLAQPSDIFLRLPGQWDDPIWQNPTAGAGIYYNVHRWYENGTGRYGSADPLGIQLEGDTNPYLYAGAAPLVFVDPLGQRFRLPNPFGPLIAPLKCALALGRNLQSSFPPNTGDKFKHCVVSCRILEDCGLAAATAAGIGKELQDAVGPGDASIGDFIADYEGILCGIDTKKGKFCRDCDSCCGSGANRNAATAPFLIAPLPRLPGSS